MGLDMRDLLDLKPDQIKALTEASANKAVAFREARAEIATKFEGSVRVSLDKLLAFLDKSVEQYEEGTDPAYWTAAPSNGKAPAKTTAAK